MKLSQRLAKPRQTNLMKKELCWYCDTPEDLPAPYGFGRVEDKDPEDIVDGLGTTRPCCRGCYRRGREAAGQAEKKEGRGGVRVVGGGIDFSCRNPCVSHIHTQQILSGRKEFLLSLILHNFLSRAVSACQVPGPSS